MSIRSLQVRTQKTFRRTLARTLGIEIEPARRFDVFLSLLRRRMHLSKDFFFVQIGANDGVRFDPIHSIVRQHRLRGLVVEPLPDLYERLTENYRMWPGVVPVNVAIHASNTEMVMYRVDPEVKEAPNWAAGIASFDAEHHLKSEIPANWIIRETVRCVTLEKLLWDHGVTHIDLLQIDTEGYDAEIIRMVDFDRMAPWLIRFEHSLSYKVMAPAVFADIVQLLGAHGYDVVIEEHDAVAYRRSP